MMVTKTKEKLDTEITLSSKDKSVTMTGEEFDKATGEILGGQLALFEGHKVQLIQNAVKGGEIVIFNEDGTGRFKDVLKFGEKIRIAATAEVVKVTHARDKDGALVRVQTLAINMADLEYKVT
jgi:hypothetical protein